jgi:two-component system, OmpR family, response regulator RegX3
VSARLLIVEDEATIAESLQYALRAEAFDAEIVGTGEAALERLAADPYDLVILDVMLPGISGIEVCRRIRTGNAVPILMLTARTAVVDVVVGLEAGADDYVQKPFSMPELVSRVRAMLRRQELDRADGAGLRRVAGIELDLRRHAAVVDGRAVQLTLSELKLLDLLTEEPGRVFSRRELMRRLWESEYVGDERACDAHITNLRRKIERDPSNPQRIVTVRGVGYMLSTS